jgi:hypothetical protein
MKEMMPYLVFAGLFVFVMFIGYLVDPKLRNFINGKRK